MKHLLQFIKLCLLSIMILFSVILDIHAQTDPGTANLKHQWTFDNGTANDAVSTSPANGTLMGGAIIVNKALKLSGVGQYLYFSGATLALNTYPVISQEIWFTPVSGSNTGYTMLSYFGNTSGGLGYNYVSTSTARGDDVSRTCISSGTYSNEIGVNGTEYDDGKLHHMVSVVRADSVVLYIDGVLISKTANTIALSTIGTSLAYLGKGGYTGDPTWLGTISRFSIYNKSLSASEVKFLYQQGAETTPILSASVANLSFDNLYTTEIITVSAMNLTSPVSITSPPGISVSPASLAANANSSTITITYDGTTTVNGNVTLTSGSEVLNIPVKSSTNSCFTKLYPTLTNLITDPYISKLLNFGGWGNRTINTNPNYVFCGATSGNVSGANAGSLDVSLTGKLIANTKYRVKAKVYAIGGTFQLGVSGIGTSDFVKTISATNAWQEVDFSFTTGGSLGATPLMFFNNYGLTGTNGYIDNWEMYAVPKVYSSATSLTFEAPGAKAVTVRAVNLSDIISITASEGFSVSPTTMPANTNGSTLAVTFNSTISKTGYIYFNSESIKDSMQVSGSVAPTLVVLSIPLLVDELSKTATFTVKGYNLTSEITFSAPAGITFSPATLPATANGTTVTITYDGKQNSSGKITLTSGSAAASLNITAKRNDECFTPLFPGAVNLITDPTCNSYTTDGWGTKSINSDPNYVYCGARSGKVTGSGSLDRNLTGVMKPNTTYRVKAKVFKFGSRPGQNMGDVTYTLGIDPNIDPVPYQMIKEAMDSACMYFSKYTPFAYNIWVYYNAGIPTAQADYHGSIGFGANTRYMWVGTAMHEMCHWLGSGSTNEWQAKMVNGVWTGTATAALVGAGVIHGDTQHFWPHGINQKEEVTGLGSIAAQQAELVTAAKLAKTMLADDAGVPTNNTPVGVGVYGWDATKGDIYNEVKTTNFWQDIDFTFTTGSTLGATQGVFFNSGTGYIDNWEMYEVFETNTLNKLKASDYNIYAQNRNIICDFTLPAAGAVEFYVYNIQGMLLSKHTGFYSEEKNHIILNNVNLNNGVYIVRMQYGGNKSSISKLIL